MNTMFVLSTALLSAHDPLFAEVVAGQVANLERVRTLSATYTDKSFQDGKSIFDHNLSLRP